MKIVLTYTELRALLAPVIPHACTDDMLPVLTRIAVAASGEHLVAQATNRFTAAFQRMKPAAKPPKTFGVQIAARDAKRMLHLLRPTRGSNPEITIEVVQDGGIRVSVVDSGLALGFSGIDIAFPTTLQDGGDKFPNLAGLLPDNFDEAVTEIGVNPDLLNAFKAAADIVKREHGERAATVNLHMPAKPGKAIVITIGDDFLGVLMPRYAFGERHDRSGVVAANVETWRGKIPVNGIRSPKSKPAQASA